jgi:hypothetical protein
MNKTKKQRPFAIDHEKRKARRNALRRSERTYGRKHTDGSEIETKRVIENSVERAESLSIVQEMAQAFASTLEFYKSDWGGAQPHEEAVKKNLSMNEWRREYVKGLQPEKVDWTHLGAIAELDVNDSLNLWIRLREAADDELESGRRAAVIVGSKREPETVKFFNTQNSLCSSFWFPDLIHFQTASDFCSLIPNAV